MEVEVVTKVLVSVSVSVPVNVNVEVIRSVSALIRICFVWHNDSLVDVVVTVAESCGSVVLDVKVVVLVKTVVVGAGVMVETGLIVDLTVWVKYRDTVLVEDGTGLVDLVASLVRQSS